MNRDKNIFEKIYEEPDAVWTRHNPPAELSDLIVNEQIKPCKAIDIGCGEGYYSIYLASQGFDVVGIDLSEHAIGYAKQNAEKANVNVRFFEIDIDLLPELNEQFDFVFEWSVLHHIMPAQRRHYVENICKLLCENGKYLSACFNEKSLDVFDSEGLDSNDKYRISPVGTRLYYSSQDELIELFEPYFQINETKLITFEGPPGISHVLNYFFMEKL